MHDDPVIVSTIQALVRFNPKSVFVYGSRGRGDAKPNSDYELGIIFDDDKYVQRSDIHTAITDKRVKAYPFKWGELSQGTFGHVFQKSLYLREIIRGGQTVAGEHLIEQIPPPPITTLDLIQDIRFYIGRALDAMLVYREGHKELGMEMFSKACFFGLRDLEILELRTFPLGYDELYELSAKVVTDPQYREVVEAAHAYRKTGKVAEIDILYRNISLLDTLIEPKVIAMFKTKGDLEVI